MEFFNQASSILATLAPAAGIVNTGFAFQDYDAVWKAMDGDLGTYVRAQIEKSGIVSVIAVVGQRLPPDQFVDARRCKTPEPT